MSIRSLGFNILFCTALLIPIHCFAQVVESTESEDINGLSVNESKPKLHYSVNSNFLYIPGFGSISGISFSPHLRFPVTPKLSVEGGIVVGRYIPVIRNFSSEAGSNLAFNDLSIYGSANYQLNKRLSIYGSGVRQLSGNNPFYNQNFNRITFGSTLNFGNFSIGAAIQMTDWNNNFTPYPYRGEQNFFPGFP